MRRETVVLGRLGMVLLVIGLAMFLISLIPAAQTSSFGGGGTIKPESFWSPPSGLLLYSMVLTPQQSLSVTVEANTTITVYLLDVNATYLAEQTEGNLSKLVQFLEANSDVLLRPPEIVNGKAQLEEYVPPKIVSFLLIFSNFGSQTALVEYEIGISYLIAPTKRVQTPAQWLIPIGAVLALPWLILSRTKKTSL